MSEPTKFIERCLQGYATLEEADEAVRDWHEADTAEMVWDYLGMGEDEYTLWLEKPFALRYIVAAHRQRRPVAELVASGEQFAVAARADNPGEARKLVQWLRQTDRLK